MFRSTEKLSVCELLARVRPFLGRWNEESVVIESARLIQIAGRLARIGYRRARVVHISRMHNKLHRLARRSFSSAGTFPGRPVGNSALRS